MRVFRLFFCVTERLERNSMNLSETTCGLSVEQRF